MLPRSPRAVVLWLAAIAVAVGTAALVASDLAALHRHAAGLGDERAAVVTTHPLTLGTIVGAGDVRTRRIHSSQLPPGVLASTDAAVGRVVTVPMVRGTFVSSGNLAPRRRTGLDGALPSGTRAVRVERHRLDPTPPRRGRRRLRNARAIRHPRPERARRRAARARARRRGLRPRHRHRKRGRRPRDLRGDVAGDAAPGPSPRLRRDPRRPHAGARSPGRSPRPITSMLRRRARGSGVHPARHHPGHRPRAE